MKIIFWLTSGEILLIPTLSFAPDVEDINLGNGDNDDNHQVRIITDVPVCVEFGTYA